MSREFKNMRQNNEQQQDWTQWWEHVSQDNGQLLGERNIMRWRASGKMGSIYFISPMAYGMNPVFTVVGTFIFRIQHLGLGKSVVIMAAFLLPVTTLKKN